MVEIQKPSAFAGIIGTFMGRDALALAAMHLKLRPEDRVLLPAYGCKEVIKPFLGRASVHFYDIAADLTLLPEDLGPLFQEQKPKAFVIINYFGFLQPHRAEIKRLCAEHGVTLIEDCAHSLLTDGSGEVGDICIFSFRKHLPLADGGGIKVNRGSERLRAEFSPRIYSDVLSLLSRAKSRLKVRSTRLSRSGMQTHEKASSSRKVLPLSAFAARRMSKMDLGEVVEKCRSDYRKWEELITGYSSMTPLFPTLPAGVCPLGFPLRSTNREQLVQCLEGQGVYLKRYWRLSELVGSEHVNSHQLAREVFALPVFPELRARDAAMIAEALATEESHCPAHA